MNDLNQLVEDHDFFSIDGRATPTNPQQSMAAASRNEVKQMTDSNNSRVNLKDNLTKSFDQKCELHKKNQLKVLNEKMTSSEAFMEHVMYKVPLKELYKVIASCQFNEQGKFCPVLVELVHEDIIKQYGHNIKYLLQVWTNKGEMIFEKPLERQVTNWNISNNKFIFQESSNSPDVYVVRLCQDDFVEGMPKSAPVIFKFSNAAFAAPKLSEANFEEAKTMSDNSKPIMVSTTQLEQQSMLHLDDSILAPVSYPDDCTHHDLNAQPQLLKSGNSVKISPEQPASQLQTSQIHVPRASVTDMAQARKEGGRIKLMEQAPDHMIDFLEGNILLAQNNKLVYCNVDDVMNQQRSTGANFVAKEITEGIQTIKIPNNEYSIELLQDIGDGMTAIVLQDRLTKELRFMRAEIDQQDVRSSRGQNRIKLIQLGAMLTKVNLNQPKSPLLKFRSVSKTDIDPKTKKRTRYQVGIAIRKNGKVEVYSDFILVDEHLQSDHQCVDVETSFGSFSLKMVKNCNQLCQEDFEQVDGFNDIQNIRLSELEKLKDSVEILVMPHIWRNRISINTSMVKKSAKIEDDWEVVLHKRIAGYFKLFSQLLNYQVFMLVSHGKMISVFDMSLRQWVFTVSLENHIRQMFIKKRSKERRSELRKEAKMAGRRAMLGLDQQFDIICINGSKYIQTVQIDKDGGLQLKENLNFEDKADVQGNRLIHFKNDDQFNSGLLFLTDDQKAGELYQYQAECNTILYNYQIEERPNATYYLHVLKHGKMFPLLSSNDQINLQSDKKASCLSYDSYFKVLRTSKGILQVDEKILKNDTQSPLAQDVKAFVDAYDEKDTANVLICTSDSNDRSVRFVMIKERGKKKVIEKMRLLSNLAKDIAVVKKSDDEPPLHSFFVTEDEYGDNKDKYIQVSEKMITVYDQSLKNVNLRVEGLNIRSCLDVNQSYMYTISSQIDRNFEVYVEDAEEPEIQPTNRYSKSGFYVYDIAKLLQGKIEKYQLADAIGGVCNLLDNSKFSDRFSFMLDYNTIAVIPFPHLNLINCIGMEMKNEYVLWRERNGFFTALDRNGDLMTWSLLSGKLLYKEPQTFERDGHFEKIEPYQVYRSDPTDITYTQRFYEYKDFSINLWKSSLPFIAISDSNKSPILPTLDSQDDQSETISYNNGSVKLDRQLDGLLNNSLKRKNTLQMTHNMNNGRLQLDEGVSIIKQDIFQTEPPADLHVLNSQQQTEKYHFKVMQMQVYQDFQRLGTLESLRTFGDVNKVTLRFHFFFDLILKPKESEDKLQEFDWDIGSDLKQRLFLSQDTKLLMEVINNFTAKVYARTDVNQRFASSGEDCGQEVEWKPLYVIKDFPKNLFESISLPYIFSPNFTHMLDFDYQKQQFVIKTTATGKVKLRIPNDLVSLTWGNMEFKDAIKQIASRFKWINEREFNFVNERNLDSIFRIEDDLTVRLISTVKIDNLFENSYKRDSPHLLLQPTAHKSRDVLERLIRMNQDYKRYVQHSLASQKVGSKILAQISRVDYLQHWDNLMSKFDIELSFTWLDWRLLELEIYDDTFNIEDVDDEQKIQLAFNIFPMGRGALHYLALGVSDQDRDDHVKNSNSAAEFFKTANVPHDFGLVGVDTEKFEDGKTPLEIPILPDMFGTTPLDMCLAITTQRQSHLNVFYEVEESENVAGRSENEMMADLIFSYIKDYGFMHSSQLIHEAIIKATKRALPSIGDYFESRLILVDYISNTQNPIKSSQTYESDSLGEYGVIPVNILCPESHIVNQMFEKKQQEVSQVTMEMHFCDVPSLFKPTQIGKDFINSLSKNKNIDLFNNKSIQVLINSQQQYWMKIDVVAFFMPRVIQLIIFAYWSNIVLPNLDTDTSFSDQNVACSYLMNLISLYILIMDIPRLVAQPKLYVRSLSTWVNLTVLVLILVNTVDQDIESERFWSIQTWTALFIWFRFLLKIRIFKQFSWLIRMIIACIQDMFTFMIVLIIGVLAFADALYSINKVLELNGSIQVEPVPNDATFYEKYWQGYVQSWQASFLLALGDWGENLEHYRESDWLVFFLAVIFNIILLLNLLIAIISETFAAVAEKASANSYKEKVTQIQEMQISIFGKLRHQGEIDSNQLLFLANVKATANEEESQESKIDKLCKDLEEVKASVSMLVEKLCPAE